MEPKLRILVVDDEPLIRQTSALVLEEQGYEVRTAEDGFAALSELHQSLPDLIVSDLSMPKMSGFEFLAVVRRRLPQIPVIAISGEYSGTEQTAAIADAYFNKGSYTPEELFARISELLEDGPPRPPIEKPESAPVWIPRNGSGNVMITCTECLRSFSVPEKQLTSTKTKVKEVRCEFCDVLVQVSIDSRLKTKIDRGPKR